MIKRNLLIKLLLLINLLIPFLLLFIFNDLLLKIGVPLIVGCIFVFLFSLILYKFNTDKFVPKIFIITSLFHFIVAVFIQVLKYGILDLNSYYGFSAIGIDDDGWLYHSLAINKLENKVSEGPFFSEVVYYIYKVFGINEFNVCVVNSILSGFIPVVIYSLSKKIYNNNLYSKVLAYIIAFSLTVAAYTTVLMRDVYIMLFSYLIIFYYYKFQVNFSYLNLCKTVIFFVLLCMFRAYAAAAVLSACVVAHLVKLAKFKIRKNIISINKYSLLLIILISVLLIFCIVFNSYLKLDYIISLFDMEKILEVSEIGYGGANSSFGVNRTALSHCLPLFLAFGYFCMFFAPFPHQWLLSRNVVQAFSAPETIILYIFLIPSFFKGMVKGFKEKKFIVMASALYIMFVFTFYGMILDNSGAVFRGRAPFIPLIFLIAVYTPGKFLTKVLNIVRDKLKLL